VKRVIVRSVFDAFDYVMEHYYPNGLEDMAERSDSYAVISIQDTHTEGFGLTFAKSRSCRDVLTLYFDDTVKEVDGAVLFCDEQADAIIDFVLANKDSVDTLLIHCYAGQSRSRAVGAFVTKMLGGNTAEYENGTFNEYVYDVLEAAWLRRICAK